MMRPSAIDTTSYAHVGEQGQRVRQSLHAGEGAASAEGYTPRQHHYRHHPDRQKERNARTGIDASRDHTNQAHAVSFVAMRSRINTGSDATASQGSVR